MNRSSQGPVTNIEGSDNDIKNIVNSEFSLFHYSDLSDKVENYKAEQDKHNTVKYVLIGCIVIILISGLVFKCLGVRKQTRRDNEINEGLEMMTFHNSALVKKGLISKTYNRTEEKKKKRKQEKKKEQKKRRRFEYDSEDGEEVGDGKKENMEQGDDKKQKLMSSVQEEENRIEKKEKNSNSVEEGENRIGKKEKKSKRRLRWVSESESE